MRLDFTPMASANYRRDYAGLATRLELMAQYDQVGQMVLELRKLCKTDLFFLLYFVLGVKQVNHPWIIDRITEVELNHNRTLDLWSREHFKSTLLTYGLTIQELLLNPEERICIFSHTRGIAKAFLRRIKLTFESNDLLKLLFPDVLYSDPKGQSPKWSEDDGIIIRRRGVYNEATLEAWGLVDGMPTSRHYTIRVYDDVVTKDSVSTAEQIKKTDEAFKLSQFLGARGGSVRVIGTRYHFADQYSKMKASGAWELRERKGVEVVDGAETSVFLTQAELQDFKKVVCDGNTYIYNCQMLLDPVAEEAQEFKKGWLRYYRTLPDRAMNLYLFVDPASEKKKKGSGSDYTVMWVWGLDPMGNHFLVDMIRERLNLFEKWKHLSKLMRKHPTIKKVYYERYGMQADIQHYQHMMKEDGVYFSIEELGGSLKKEDRIRKLVPMFENYKVYLPEALYSEVDGRDLVKEFIEEEYLLFPFASHDDGLDAASRIKDEKAECYPPVSFPTEEESEDNVVQMNTWANRKAQSRYANA
jgi:predicted phage terminase large subunit-like protein